MPSLKANGRRLNGKGSGWISRELRTACYLRDSFRCAYCERDLRYVDAAKRTLDHIEPKVNGANHHPHNLLTCCLSCNSKRQHTPFRDWVERLALDSYGPDDKKLVVQLPGWRRSVAYKAHKLRMQARRKLPLELARSLSRPSKGS